MKKKKRIGIILIILIIGLLGWTGYRYVSKPKTLPIEKEMPSQPEEPEIKKAKLTIVGDFLFEQPFYNSLEAGDDANHYFQKVKPYFQNDDITIGNMEVVIGNDNLEVSGVGYSFCAPQSIGNLVNTLGIEVLSTANNHTYDRGLAGIRSTLDFFRNQTDILTVGTYYDEEDTTKDRILEKNGITFGFLSYTYGTNQRIPVNERNLVGLYREPGVTYVTKEYEDKLKKEVGDLRKKVDVVIVMMHWGKEFTYSPNEEQINMAHLLNEAGADIIIGNHSHSIEPIGWIGTDHISLVYYSLGNFVSADNNITRTSEEFNNAYQFGLLSTLEITKEQEQIAINEVNAEPIINYYDSNLRNFELIPLKDYSAKYNTTHNRYTKNFTKSYVQTTFERVVPSEFRSKTE